MGPMAQYAPARAAALTGDTAAPGLSLRKDSPLPAAATAYSGAHRLPTQRRPSASVTMLGSISGGCLEPPTYLGADTSLRGPAASASGARSTSSAATSIPEFLGGGPIIYISSPHDRPEAGRKELPSSRELHSAFSADAAPLCGGTAPAASLRGVPASAAPLSVASAPAALHSGA